MTEVSAVPTCRQRAHRGRGAYFRSYRRDHPTIAVSPDPKNPHVRPGSPIHVLSHARLSARRPIDQPARKVRQTPFTHTLAVDLAKHGIRANTICPGSIIPPMREYFAKLNGAGRSVEEMYKVFAQPVPCSGSATPGRLQNSRLFLAGPRSGFCTGSQFTADGGLLAGIRLF